MADFALYGYIYQNSLMLVIRMYKSHNYVNLIHKQLVGYNEAEG
jgi:hypothetical protein